MEKSPLVIFPQVKVETLKFQQFYLVKFKVSTLTYGKMTRGHFSIINKFLQLKKDFSNLEPEGQGWRIIMEVTRLLLLGLFYTKHMQIYVLFCTRLYMKRFSNVIQNADFNHYLMFAKLLFTQPISDSPTKKNQ